MDLTIKQTTMGTYENGVPAYGWCHPYQWDPETITLDGPNVFRQLQQRYGKCTRKLTRNGRHVGWAFHTWTPGAGVLNDEIPYDPSLIDTIVTFA